MYILVFHTHKHTNKRLLRDTSFRNIFGNKKTACFWFCCNAIYLLVGSADVYIGLYIFTDFHKHINIFAYKHEYKHLLYNYHIHIIYTWDMWRIKLILSENRKANVKNSSVSSIEIPCQQVAARWVNLEVNSWDSTLLPGQSGPTQGHMFAYLNWKR